MVEVIVFKAVGCWFGYIIFFFSAVSGVISMKWAVASKQVIHRFSKKGKATRCLCNMPFFTTGK
jgi:hypothetical protein